MKKWVGFVLAVVSLASLSYADGRTLYKKCKGCHGKTAMHAPFEIQTGIIAGRTQEELQAIMIAIKNDAYKDGKLNQIMKKTISRFSNEEIEELAKYISTFKRDKTQ